jgi:hypothetical protein
MSNSPARTATPLGLPPPAIVGFQFAIGKSHLTVEHIHLLSGYDFIFQQSVHHLYWQLGDYDHVTIAK